MYVIVWQYDVHHDRIVDFESIYGADGKWTDLFRSAPGYVRTDLLRDTKADARYVTLDFWESEEAFRAFIDTHRQEYLALDEETKGLIADEVRLGALVMPYGLQH